MKKLRVVVYVFVGLLALLFFVSWRIGKGWGADATRLEVTEGARAFWAERDTMGVWHIRPRDVEGLWFGFGYVQTHDREFQLELLRAAALGRLSAIFGSSQLSRDRLMRLMTPAAQAEWDSLAKDAPLRLAIESFLAGRANYLKAHPDRVPVEYRVFGLKRADFADWEPWHVIAVSRLHAWEFSYDRSDTLITLGLRAKLGDELASLLMPIEREDTPETLYRQPLARGMRLSLGGGRGALVGGTLPSLVLPPAGEKSDERSASRTPPPSDFFSLGAEQGASNLWVIANPRTALAPTLCNDTHLGFSWPSFLYPVAYEIGSVSGQGFMLPGAPGIVIGRVDRPGKNFVWGITIANYASTQDFVEVGERTLARATRRTQKFTVRDPRTGQTTEESFPETWTEFGPLMEGVQDWRGYKPKGPVALDWIGYRNLSSPLNFYLRRNLQGQDLLREDLAAQWAFPSVNFAWMERDPQRRVRFGHAMTGVVFERSRTEPRALLTEAQARSRRASVPAARPFLDHAYTADKTYLFVTANQSIYPSPLSGRLAYEWGDPNRARRVISQIDALSMKPESAQTDFVSPTLAEFVRLARTRVSADRLCAEGDSEFMASCFEVTAELDRWDGELQTRRWEPTLVALWHAKFKERLWPAQRWSEDAAALSLFEDWHKSNGAFRAARLVLNSPRAEARWAKATHGTLGDALTDSFREALRLLVDGLGASTPAWAWGRVHRMDWRHPAKLIPGRMGQALSASLLGEAPSLPGGLDSPGRFDYAWSPARPLEFPARHGAAMRFCATLPEAVNEPTRLRWALSTGVSGNPLSIWSRTFAQESFFKNELIPATMKR